MIFLRVCVSVVSVVISLPSSVIFYFSLFLLMSLAKGLLIFLASLVAQRVKGLPATRENWVWSLGQEDPLEKAMATHSSTLVWKIPWMEEPGRLQSMGSKVGHD